MKSFTALTLGLVAAPMLVSGARVNQFRRDSGRRTVHAIRDHHLSGHSSDDVNVVGDGNVVEDSSFSGLSKLGSSGGDTNVIGNNNIIGGASEVANIIIIWANPGGGAETTQINEQVTVTQTVTAPPAAGTPPPPAAAATHTVIVGGDDLVYIPDQLNDVPVGDMVIFQFMQQNHTVTQSSFATPCDPLDGGLDTGFQPNADNAVSPPPQVAMQVTTTEPLWFYCKQMGHCGKGMVFSINPTAEKSQAKFKELAIQQEGDAAQSTPTPAPPPANNGTTLVGGGTGATPGQGLIGSDGSCHCVVSCSAGGFPASSVQGLGSIGGMAGSLPMGDARV